MTDRIVAAIAADLEPWLDATAGVQFSSRRLYAEAIAEAASLRVKAILGQAGHRTSDKVHDCFLTRCSALGDELDAARRHLCGTPPVAEDLADTFCFLRRHEHAEETSCEASRDEAERVTAAIAAREDYRARPAKRIRSTAEADADRAQGKKDGPLPLVGVRNGVRHYLRSTDLRRTLCGLSFTDGPIEHDTVADCPACLRPVAR